MKQIINLIDWGKEVLEGWNNIDNNHPVVQFIKSYRYKHCIDCPKNFFNVCKGCGCPLKSKIGSYRSVCPDKKWVEVELISEIKGINTHWEVYTIENNERVLIFNYIENGN